MVKIENLNVKFNSKVIFENFSHEFKEKELTVIFGGSGSGKTTLLNIIGMLESNYSGKVFINDNLNTRFDSRIGRKILKKNIGFIFQNYGLIDNKTVYENLNVGMNFVKKNKKEKIKMMNACLKEMNMEDKLFEKVYRLSGGEQQRVALGRILLKNCDIILADEPTGSLDEENKQIVIGNLKKMRDEGKTVIVVTHDNTFKRLADKCIEI